MKLHFEADLPYQGDAIEAVCDLFRGQEVCRSEFTVTMRAPSTEATAAGGPLQATLEGMQETEQGGVGNRLTLLDDEIEGNLRAIQLRNGLAPSTKLSGDFTVEMETGTGKTYVYLRTVFELNKRYGFTKFVIVVPSVAIKEGVNKTLQITREHFDALYPSAKGYEFFQYDSAKLGDVRTFATSPNVQIMVITVGAINKFGDEEEAAAEESDEVHRREKSKNVMYRASEKTGYEKPIDLVRNTRPIVIVDEPQSVDGGIDGRGKKALDRMNPLCSLRYSATHVDKHNMVYRLDAVDAYEQKLVKQIEVAAATVEAANNKPFVKLVSVSNKHGAITAKVELDVENRAGAVQRKQVPVQDGDDLQQTTRRVMYANMRIGTIRTAKGDEFVELHVPGDQIYLRPGDAWGDVDATAVQREMIRRTIKEHLDKEKLLGPKGVKVLSLFFIDAVDKYRQYDEDGNALKGEYARIFEEEYKRWAKHPDYQSLFGEIDLNSAADEVHNGYFSIDRKKIGSKTVEVFKDTSGETKADDDTYNLIMRDKEKLLSFSSPLKFIFSHSALKEGWDNPNVFQICNFSTRETERWRRQTIGRGLRLCVNQDGQRVRGFEVNTLTVIATESYQQFAENLQKDIEKETGIQFGVVPDHLFAVVAVTQADGKQAPLGFEPSKALADHLKAQGYIDAKGKVQDSLKKALKDSTLVLPIEFEAQRAQITELLRKASGKLEIKNADERRSVPVRRAVLDSPEFKALWDRIKQKTTYRVQFDNSKLIGDCIKAFADAPPITRTRLQWRKAGMAIGKAGVEATERGGADIVNLNEADIELPDVLTELQDRTQLTRRSIGRILTESNRLGDFKRNPQQFIEISADVINRCKRNALVDGIRYQRLGDAAFYAQELFEQEELTGYLKNMLKDTEKSVYQHVVYDSDVEKDFADQLEKNTAIKVYAKLPGWFTVPTPLGTYNPDWAVLVTTPDGDKLYFVAETKGSLFADDLRDRESAKIECGRAHFHALAVGENPARYGKFKDVAGLLNEVADQDKAVKECLK
ncbi:MULTISPECIES: type III restriction-modification system endonuclease [Paraburkholderia]|uniref:type III restriction-modification system endonuclease n=1 Tax=Paraburkholderia TaxID=1822464 RepID=UPI00224CA467|nr:MULTISPECIES: DEAD/DEAH box helicase family protein [Paraburkholderia]MCX4175657.1 DEAD/DEAH box helicase family protein [Paraburkholderia madseniana]MDQ6463652.1 DEAD/DEAH box helicase family protein [Paraburkholderia madseniana]